MTRQRKTAALVGVAVTATAAIAACGSAENRTAAQVSTATANLTVENGLSANGLSANGLSANGLSANGLSANGLSANGFDTAGFQSWFDQDPATASMMMMYVARCAAAEGASYTWTNPSTGVTYTWPGLLNLAPGWASGNAATQAEQQIVSACLAAHANKYGVHLPISVQGRGATGVPIPLAPGELSDYSVREGCFFGNLFSGEGLFVGLDHSSWDAKTSSARACALDTRYKGTSVQCPPLYQFGYCKDVCKLDPSKTYYASCSYGGKSYLPITTRLRPAEVYKCGDGVCQFTESCGTGADWDNCKSDCGVCQ